MKNSVKKSWLAALALMMAGCSTSSAGGTQNDMKTESQNLSFTKLVEEFKNPSASVKPLTRWWVPGSMMDKEEVEKEIQSMIDAGFGGAEIVPVSINGGDGEGEIDWGTEQWKEITGHILSVAKEKGFTIDFTMTPAWPLALPTVTDVNDPEQGAQMEMDGAWIDGITKATPFSGTLPVSEEAKSDSEKVNGDITLVGITAAKYADKENKVLDLESASSLDISKATRTANGEYSFEFTPEDEGEYVLHAWYQHPSGNTKYGNNQLDHYSAQAAQMIIDYWQNELIPYYGDNWSAVRSLFVDSLEFETHLDWTWDLQKKFEDKFGYDITPYLPAIYDSSDEFSAIGNYMGDPVPTFTFTENSEQVQNDFKEFLTQLYIENNIKPLQKFCEENGVTLRYQTGYGKSLDTVQTAMYPDIPETESLYGNDYIDFYRLQAGAVHAMDKPIYSMETAAEWTETWNDKKEDGNYGTRGNGELNSGNYEQTFADHLWHDQRAFAGGVNQVVFHGYPYNGQYSGGVVDGTQWPGFTGFESYRWSNSWGERQPNWMFADSYTDFIARNQLVLREGTARVDLAVYHQSYYETIDFWGPEKLLNTEDLEQNGYSYDFVDSAILDLESMKVTDGILDPEGAGYKALLFDNQKSIPDATIEKMCEFADAGLTIVFAGVTPDSGEFSKDSKTSEAMTELLKKDHVIQVDELDQIGNALKENGITPDADYQDQTLLNAHREAEGTDFYYLYNYAGSNSYRDIDGAEPVSCKVLFEGEGIPYLMDAWTGEVTQITEYEEKDGKIEVSVELAPNDSTIIAVSEEELGPKADEGTPMNEAVTIDKWSLNVESWTKGETELDTDKTLIEVGELDALKPWSEIEGLENVSGVGTYTAKFELNDFKEGESAWIHMGRVKDAYQVEINGTVVPMDLIDGMAEVGSYLKSGENEIQVTVATSMLNAVLKQNENILNDDGRVLDDRSPADYGLVHDVVINGNSSLRE